MSKRKTTSRTTNSAGAVTTKTTTGRVPPNVKFPELSTKEGLECRELLEDQILLIDVRERRGPRTTTRADVFQNLFSTDECKRFVKFIDELPLELTPPKKRGEAERVNRELGNRNSCISS